MVLPMVRMPWLRMNIVLDAPTFRARRSCSSGSTTRPCQNRQHMAVTGSTCCSCMQLLQGAMHRLQWMQVDGSNARIAHLVVMVGLLAQDVRGLRQLLRTERARRASDIMEAGCISTSTHSRRSQGPEHAWALVAAALQG
jgi:hypothetical protein